MFLDTPILLASWRGTPVAVDLDAESVRTGILNQFEAIHVLLRAGQDQLAAQSYDRMGQAVLGLDREIIFEASKARVRMPERGLSYADAAGYATARKHDLLFLTTDRGFQGLPGARVLPRT